MSSLPRSGILRTEDFSVTELSAMRLKGYVYPLGDAFVTLDTPNTTSVRAKIFDYHRHKTLIADRTSASWIYGARKDSPNIWQMCHLPNHPSVRFDVSANIHQQSLAPHEICTIADIPVTSAYRTAQDLFLFLPTFSEVDKQEILYLLKIAACPVEDFCTKLAHSKRRGVKSKQRRFNELLNTIHQ